VSEVILIALYMYLYMYLYCAYNVSIGNHHLELLSSLAIRRP
jgi:hypothetical protein